MPGSHKYLYRSRWEDDEGREGYKSLTGDDKTDFGLPTLLQVQEFAKKFEIEEVRCGIGDAYIMDANLLHASPANTSPLDRAALFFVINHKDNRPTGKNLNIPAWRKTSLDQLDATLIDQEIS